MCISKRRRDLISLGPPRGTVIVVVVFGSSLFKTETQTTFCEMQMTRFALSLVLISHIASLSVIHLVKRTAMIMHISYIIFL